MHIGNMQYIGTQNRGMRETFAETSLIPQRETHTYADPSSISILGVSGVYSQTRIEEQMRR